MLEAVVVIDSHVYPGSFLVYLTAMLYPQNLIYVNLFDVLHRQKGDLLQGKRLRFFWIVVACV